MMIDERGLDIMEVEADMVVMRDWLKFEREFLGSRYNATERNIAGEERQDAGGIQQGANDATGRRVA